MFGSAHLRPGARRWIIAPVVFVLAFAAGTVVQAAITSDPGPFTGCLAAKTTPGSGTTKGQVYNVARTGPTAPCLKGDTQIVFSNAQGPKGDKGDQGIQGIQGIQGAKGDAGDPGNHPERFWEFRLPASTTNEEDASTETFPRSFFDRPGQVTSELGGYAYAYGDGPSECDFAKLDLRISSGTKNLFEYFINDPHSTTYELTNPTGAGTSDGDPGGFGMKVVVRCFKDDGVNGTPVDGHPGVAGLVFFKYEEPPVGFDGSKLPTK